VGTPPQKKNRRRGMGARGQDHQEGQKKSLIPTFWPRRADYEAERPERKSSRFLKRFGGVTP